MDALVGPHDEIGGGRGGKGCGGMGGAMYWSPSVSSFVFSSLDWILENFGKWYISPQHLQNHTVYGLRGNTCCC